MTPEVETELIRLWNDGVPEKQIAYAIGYSVATVRAYACLHRDKCPYRRQHVKSDAKELWVERIKAGRYTVAQAAEALGVSRVAVRRWLRK